MQSIDLNMMPEKEIVKGFRVRFVHSQNMTIGYWNIEKGAALPEHSHLHEQIANCIEGEFELIVDGEPIHMKAGSVVVIPSDVPHGGRAITDAKLVDVFYPVREDYK